MSESRVVERGAGRLRVAERFAIGGIRLYQWTLSTWLGGSCRFFPSCSEYAVLAIRRYGVWRGGWRSAKRVFRCRPFQPGGLDLP